MSTYFPILEVSTVVGCRMGCSVCPQATHVRSYAGRGDRHMTLATFQRCLATVPRRVEVMFAGMAEPWLNRDATSMVEHASSLGHPISLYSTLVGMTQDDVVRLSRVTMRTSLCVHLPDAAGDMHLDVDDAYLATLRSVVATLPHHFVLFGALHPRVRAVLGHDVRDDTAGTFSRAGNLVERRIPRKTGALACSACGPKIDHNVLLPSGDVALCCQVYDLKHVIGNLTTMTYDELFTSEAYATVMRGLAGDESVDLACRTCELAVRA